MIDAMIFSRNRPMQLHALLSSIENLTNLSNVSVLHRYDENYREGLERVKSFHSNVSFIEEKDFESQLKSYISNGEKYCVFFVDDMLVKKNVDVNVCCQILEHNPEFLTFSLHMGTHLSYCYPMNSPQQVPNGAVNSGYFVWGWKDAQYDWGYPFSVDGHIFRRHEIESWTSHLSFKNPNQFESEMLKIPHIFAVPNGMICELVSSVFNMPINRVQNEIHNRAEEVSVVELYNDWMNGFEFDTQSVVGFINHDAHEPIKISYRKQQ